MYLKRRERERERGPEEAHNRLNKVCVLHIDRVNRYPLHSNKHSAELTALSINFQSQLPARGQSRWTDSNWMLPVHIKNSLTIDYS